MFISSKSVNSFVKLIQQPPVYIGTIVVLLCLLCCCCCIQICLLRKVFKLKKRVSDLQSIKSVSTRISNEITRQIDQQLDNRYRVQISSPPSTMPGRVKYSTDTDITDIQDNVNNNFNIITKSGGSNRVSRNQPAIQKISTHSRKSSNTMNKGIRKYITPINASNARVHAIDRRNSTDQNYMPDTCTYNVSGLIAGGNNGYEVTYGNNNYIVRGSMYDGDNRNDLGNNQTFSGGVNSVQAWNEGYSKINDNGTGIGNVRSRKDGTKQNIRYNRTLSNGNGNGNGNAGGRVGNVNTLKVYTKDKISKINIKTTGNTTTAGDAKECHICKRNVGATGDEPGDIGQNGNDVDNDVRVQNKGKGLDNLNDRGDMEFGVNELLVDDMNSDNGYNDNNYNKTCPFKHDCDCGINNQFDDNQNESNGDNHSQSNNKNGNVNENTVNVDDKLVPLLDI